MSTLSHDKNDQAPASASGNSVRRTAKKLLIGLTKLIGAFATILLIFVGALIVLATLPYWPMLVGFLLLGAAIILAWRLWHPYAIGLIMLILIASVAVASSQLRASTPPITDSQGRVLPGSIATIERVKLGGVDQWLVIRGTNTSNPLLLFLNGGPGGTQLAWHLQYMRNLEDHFTMVYWEQRGSGKSAPLVFSDYGRMTSAQYVKDGLELTNYLRKRFGQDKIYLAGQSWGTMLGVWMIQEQPELFAAFVGIGQMTSPVEDDRLIYDFVMARAREEGNTAVIQNLETIGPPPYNGFWETTKYGQIFGLVNGYQHKLVEASDPLAIEPLVGMTETPEYGIADAVAAYLGAAVTFARVYDQLDDVDLESQAPKLEVPIFFAEGRYDLNAMTILAERYFNLLDAPYKQLVWFEHSGHNPEHEEPATFHDFLINTVLAGTTTDE